MSWVEPASLLIVAAWSALALRRSSRRTELLFSFLLLAATAWASEESCIRAYGFYAYDPCWRVFIASVPLAVVLIWPVVILSAQGLARALLPPGSGWVPLCGAALVFTDAALIEPVSVQAGLWHWTRPGLFAVPPVGVLGWALFALLALRVLELPSRRALWALLIPPGVHALLLLAWWGGLRWVSCPISPWPAALLAGLLGVGVCVVVWRRRLGERVPRALLLERVPAALLFMALLLAGRAAPALVAWTLASTPAWLALTLAARVTPASAGTPPPPRPRGWRRAGHRAR